MAALLFTTYSDGSTLKVWCPLNGTKGVRLDRICAIETECRFVRQFWTVYLDTWTVVQGKNAMRLSLAEIKAAPSTHPGHDLGPAFQYRNNVWKHLHVKPTRYEAASEGHALGMVDKSVAKQLKVARKGNVGYDDSFKIVSIIHW